MSSEISPSEEELLPLESWDDNQDEEEPVDTSSVVQAVVTDTDWTAETILSQLRRGNIQLNPRFQRRDAWDGTRKSRFIESVILGLPIPQLVLAEDKRRRGAFIVLDGKQRLLALRQFAEGSAYGGEPGSSEFRNLRLSGLDVRRDLQGYNLARLDESPDHIDDVNAILNQTIRTVVVRRWPDEAFLNLVFLRLNTGSVQLSPQELRQALHPGPFTEFIDDYTADSQPVKAALRIKQPDFRMRDVEILLRYYAFQLYLKEYRGNLKAFLDLTNARLNSSWEEDAEAIEQMASDFDFGILTAFAIFGRNAFFRWAGTRYERRFNRALFDALMYYFSDHAVRVESMEKKTQIEQALRSLCEDDYDFVRSIQTTTKTIGATFYRLEAWGQVLNEVLDTRVVIPKSPADKLLGL